MLKWNKDTIIKEIDSKSKIKTYLARIEPIVKEIIPKDKEDYYTIIERLEKFKEELKEKLYIFSIIEENKKLYIYIDNNEEILTKLDKLILSDELDIKKEGIIHGHGNPIKKEELFDLFKMEKSMCKISFETKEGFKGNGTGFFCQIENIKNFPIKYALFTNNHVLNESNIEIGCIINFEYLKKTSYVKKQIKIKENRKKFTNKELDYTCIELLESDGIKDFFKIEPNLFKYDKNFLKDNDIFILQFPNGNELSFSYGKILSINDNIIRHSASTDNGSSGSPIIRRSENNNIIGLHYGTAKNKYNFATIFDSILNDIKEQQNEINCIYIPEKDEKEISLLHDYNYNLDWIRGEIGIEDYYLEAKNLNKKLFEKNIDIYINDKKIKFDFKYRTKDSKEIKVKFKFKSILTNTSFMFASCRSLKSIDLSLLNTKNVNNMIGMFFLCSSLESINLSSCNTNNVKNISYIFNECSSLKSIDLSSFNANNVVNMKCMLARCYSINSIDLSSFNTSNAYNMHKMFYFCTSLKSLDLSSFNTCNVKYMNYMFSECSSLKSIDLSSFNTNKVEIMNEMFSNCSSLESIDLSSFNTNNVTDMRFMFSNCSSLESIDLSSFNTNKVDSIRGMFSGCSSLISIDISSFTSNNIKDMNCLFDECTSLKKENIKIKNKNDRLLEGIK